MLGQGSIGRILCQLTGLPQHWVEHLGRLGPTRLLAIIDLSQIQQVSLHPTAPSFDLLGNAPVAMIFAVLEPMVTMQIRLGHAGWTLPHQAPRAEEGRSAPNRFWKKTWSILRYLAPGCAKKSWITPRVAKVGLGLT